MPILSPIHLFEQAEKLIQAPPSGPPRQVDLRRAISSAYYAVFHLTLTALSDEFIGAAYRNTTRYALMHRSIDHRAVKDLCAIVSKSKPPVKYMSHVPAAGFGRDMLTFASAFLVLQDKRHRADYDVGVRYITLDARLAIVTGRSAMNDVTGADAAERRLFLTLLLCPPR